ncbi:MAG: S-layer homology domain-containing protein [Verrucomicrobiales bacterium]
MVKFFSQIGLFAILVLVVLWGSPVAAQNDGPADGPPGIMSVSDIGGTGGLPDSVDAFGTNQQWAFLHASQWMPWNNTAGGIGYGGSGYIYPLASGDDFWAQLRLPIGAQVNWIHWYVYDNDPACGWYLSFTRYEGSEGTPGPQIDVMVNQSTTDPETPGYVRLNTDLSASPQMIGSWEDINGDGLYHYTAYVLTAELLGCGGGNNLRLFGAGFNWSRVVSPAPASATFSDVPVGSFGFKHVEALSASGITAGCGGGNFCPNNTLTRVEMAVFLAKALGLHWDGTMF